MLTANLSTTGRQNHPKRSLSGPYLTTMSLNIEGLTSEKEKIISHLVKENNVDVLCLQETHRKECDHNPSITNMKIIGRRSHNKYGSAIFVRDKLSVKSVHITDEDNIEIITVDLGNITISSIYKPPNTPFKFIEPPNFQNQNTRIVIGNFNSHSISWGYADTNEDGEFVEKWADECQMQLVHDPKLPSSFNSKRWKRGYNPDNIFVSENIEQLCTKRIAQPIPRTQHRPIICEIDTAIRGIEVPFRRRYNFKKAKWKNFTNELENIITTIEPTPSEYDHFIKEVKIVSRKHIPRGCRQNYITGMHKKLENLYESYKEKFTQNPFDDETIEIGECLIAEISEQRRKDWRDTIEELNLTQNSSKAWRLLKKLNGENKQRLAHTNVSANEIAHQLIMNGKTKRVEKTSKRLKRTVEENNMFASLLETMEIETAIRELKNKKAAGVDELRTE